jgi:diguanylate cyclase (GGDEF)-like protein
LTFVLLLVAAGRLTARHLRQKSRHLEGLVFERTWELETSREQLRFQATHDGLTGMLNRLAILRALSTDMDRARREGKALVVALADLDRFKDINDTHGHQAGDEALCWFANAVRAAIRSYDNAGRYGGEEFLMVLPVDAPEAAEQRLGALHTSISYLKVCAQAVDFDLNCSIGATIFDPRAGSPNMESLLALADQALYAAKAKGRNRVVLHTSSSRCAGDRPQTVPAA